MTKGPKIGTHATNGTRLASVLAGQTPWAPLSPSVNVALRGLALSPAILEAWYPGRHP